MAKALPNSTLDATLAEVATATRITICSGEPANFAGIAAVALADVTVTPGDGNGDFTIADGTPNGRTLTVAAQSAIPVDTTGTATHVALDDGVDLLAVTTVASQALTSGNTADLGSFTLNLSDPT